MHVPNARRQQSREGGRRCGYRRYVLLLVALIVACSAARSSDPLAGSGQAIVVTTPDWKSTSGSLQRFERDGGAWRAVGDAIPIVVGHSGLAPAGEKHEGDGRSPAGIYSIGTAFGFTPSSDFRLPYRQLRDTTECVDDTTSRFYNQLVERDAVTVDWSSSEKMRKVSAYVWGAVVNYNTPAAAGKGSCIFLHVWGGPGSTTTGCTAMREEDLLTLLRWLDPAKNPRLVQFPASVATGFSPSTAR